MLRAATITRSAGADARRNTLASRLVRWGAGGITVVSGTAAVLTVYASTTDSGAGFRREVQFWSRVAPVVADYYLQTASSSPLVRYQKWRQQQQNDDDTATDAAAVATTEQQQQQQRQELLAKLHEKHAPEIFQVMLDLKGLYIKLGQVLSVTALPIPEPYRVLFRTLQSDVPGWERFEEVIRPTLERELACPALDDIFETIDPIPCGAASIGQAHRATLLTKSSSSGEEDKEEVIVKVQYPDAAWQVPADIQCVGDFLKICVWTGAVDETSATLSFEEFSRQFLAELDYNQERQNLEEIYESSLDPRAPYQRRNVVIPKVYKDLCTDKVITMTYLPGPKLEEEAKRQLAMLGIDTSKGIADIVRSAAKDAANPEEPEAGELVRRVTSKLDPESGTLARRVTKRIDSRAPTRKQLSWWKVTAPRIVGQIFGVDTILWAIRSGRRIILWSQAVAVALIQTAPRTIVPPTWESWADARRTAAEQAKRLSLTESWIDALFDVHGHQVFSLGLFNADPHPGNILVVEEADSNRPSTKLGLIDYGQCKRLTSDEQVRIARLLLSVANDEPDQAIAEAFRDLGIKTNNDSTEFLALFGRLMFGPLKPEHLDHSWHMRLHKMDRVLYFPKELSMVYRTSLLLRGLGVSLQLNYSIGDQWKQHAKDAVERNQKARID